jgi:predicted flap endonuclease-1-like 5' DNA nuclease
MAATLIAKIRGLSDDMRGLLKGLGIKDNEQLLALVRTAADRANLAEKLGVSAQTILEWANRADLMRIDGIGGVFSDLLEVAGVDTVKELATRRPDNLHAKLLETNADKKVAGRIPTLQMVQSWVEEAKRLPRMLEY